MAAVDLRIPLEHQLILMNVDQKGLGKSYQAFYEETSRLTGTYLNKLREDVHHFASMTDYRSIGSNNWAGTKDSIERSIEFLTGELIPTEDMEEFEEEEE